MSIEEIKEFIRKYADEYNEYLDSEDFSVYDLSGGNYDDAHSIGIDTGYVMLARDLIKKFEAIN